MAWFVSWHAPYPSPAFKPDPAERARYDAMARALAEKLIADWCAQGRDLYVDAPSSKTLLSFRTAGPEWPKELLHYPPLMGQGWRWPIPAAPFVARMKKVPARILDIIGAPFDAYAVSERVIDIIEDIEPGVHQYLPFEMLCPNGSPYPERRWLLNICSRAETIDAERSGCVETSVGQLAGATHDGLVVFKTEAERRAVWHEYRYAYNRSHPTISDRFWDALQAAGCKGWKPIHAWSQLLER